MFILVTAHRIARSVSRPLVCVVFAGQMFTAMAQDFTLFESVEASTNEQSLQQRPGRESRVNIAKPELTLVGTSRIGDKYSVILANSSGEKIVVKTDANFGVVIPEYSGYEIVSASSGKVSLRLPDAVPCVDYPDSGVRCNSASNIAELTLPNNPPIRLQQKPAQIAVAQAEDQAAEEIIEDSANPFAIMRARAQSGDSPDNPAFVAPGSGGDGRFVPRRIAPSEIPPGSRVVSTPFGDRLVPQ